MSSYRLSRRADADLIEIAEYGEPRWGEDAAVAYIDRLQDAAQLVADVPGIARRCDSIRPGYSRTEEGSHVLLFKQDTRGILVVRILHRRQLPGLHVSDNDERE